MARRRHSTRPSDGERSTDAAAEPASPSAESEAEAPTEDDGDSAGAATTGAAAAAAATDAAAAAATDDDAAAATDDDAAAATDDDAAAEGVFDAMKDLVAALRDGHRLAELVRSLPPEEHRPMLAHAGIPIRSGASARKVRANLESMIPRLRDDGLVRRLVLGWAGDRSFAAADGGPERLDRWTDALDCLVRSLPVPGEPVAAPDWLRDAALAVVAGRAPQLTPSEQGAWRTWFAVAQLRSCRRGLDDLVDAELEQLVGDLQSVLDDYDDDAPALEQWGDIHGRIESLHGQILAVEDDFRERWHELIEAASSLDPERIGASWNEESLPEPDWLQALDALAEDVLSGLSVSATERRAGALLALRGRIRPEPPTRDRAILDAEWAALREALAADESPELQRVAPVLWRLGRVLLDGESLARDDRDWLFEHLSGRLCLALERGELTLVALGDVPGDAAPDAAGDYGDEAGTEDAQAEEAVDESPAEAAPVDGEATATGAGAAGDLSDETASESEAAGDTPDEAVTEPETAGDMPDEAADETASESETAGDMPDETADAAASESVEHVAAPDAGAGETEPAGSKSPAAVAEAEGDRDSDERSATAAVSTPDVRQPPDAASAIETSPRREADDPATSDRDGSSGAAAPERSGAGVDAAGPEAAAEPRAAADGRGDEDSAADSKESAAEQLTALLCAEPLSTVDIAALLARGDVEAPAEAEEGLLAALLGEREFDLAALFAHALDDAARAPGWLLDTVAAGLSLQPGLRRSEQRLRELFIEAGNHVDQLGEAQAMLLAAALIRPALMAPHTHPMFVIRQLAPKLGFLSSFDGLADGLARFAEQGRPLERSLLRGLGTRSEWESERAALQQETAAWSRDASRRQTKLIEATRVWHAWAKDGGRLHDLVSHASDRKVAEQRADDLREQIDAWRSDSEFDAIVKATLEEVPCRARTRTIQFGARRTLVRYAEEALDIAERWLELWDSQPQSRGGVDVGRRALDRMQPAARKLEEALGDYRTASHGPLLRVAAGLLATSLRELQGSFQKVAAEGRPTEPLRARRELVLRMPSLAGAPEGVRGDVLRDAILRHVVDPLSPAQAALQHAGAGRFGAAEELLATATLEDREETELREELERHEREWQRRLEIELSRARDDVEGAQLRGTITETERTRLSGALEELERRLHDDVHDATHEPAAVESELGEIRAGLEQRTRERREAITAHREAVRKRFDGGELPPSIAAALDRVVEARDFSVAEELLARLDETRGDAPTDLDALGWEPERAPFDVFMERVDGIFEQAAHAPLLERHLSEGRLDGLLGLEPGGERERTQSAQALEWWSSVTGPQSSRDDAHANLRRLLGWLGFQVEADGRFDQLSRHGVPNFWTHYRVAASIAAPLPRFGSAAGGTHDFLVASGRLEPDQIAQWLSGNRQITKERPLTILYQGRFDAGDRRRMIHALRRTGHSPVVVDTCLLLWLGGVSADRRPSALFSVGLSGLADNPYTPDVAGSVPPEMFVGREEDIERIWSRNGPCIVYGGRQLGKSALLQQVVRRYHAPGDERFVLYSGTKHVSDLWELLRRRLVDEGILPKKGAMNRERTKRAIQEMLEEHPTRRLLVLLDECDDLLEADSRERFEQMALIRDLMTETDRRFKVVLAGLHSVQRFQRIPNQPLAHFGSPLCVGPLPPRAAAALVRGPLGALGYRFAPDTLVQRILAHTNCHPSLIQLFCRDLVTSLSQSAAQPIDRTPPFVVDEGAITRVYRKVELERRMRERFDWTLDLDERYRVIGYTFAWLELAGELTAESEDGLAAAQALRHVQGMWPAGFRDTDVEEIEGLLEEMVGLGLLLRSASRRYRLRSPNVLRLLGGEQAIDEELQRFRDKQPTPRSDPQVVRRLLRDGGLGSPLTLQQENRLNARERGVDIVTGSDALGFDLAYEALRGLYEDAAPDGVKWHRVSATDASRAFREIQKKNEGQRDDLRFVVLAHKMREDHVGQLVREVVGWMRKMRTDQRFVRVAFVVPAATTLRLRRDGVFAAPDGAEAINLVRLRRWKEGGLLQWFDDVGRPPPREAPREWLRDTGGWSFLLTPRQRAFLANGGEPPEPAPALTELVDQIGLHHAPDAERLFRLLVQLEADREPAPEVDLAAFAADEGVAPEIFPHVVEYLVDLDLAYRTREGIRLEAVATDAFRARESGPAAGA